MFDIDLITSAEALLASARAKSLRIVTAESCTGGLISGLLTEIAGSSDVFDRGFATYSNQAKQDHLGVPAEILAREGAVSAAVAQAMVAGALAASGAHVAVAVTGVAGPGGGSAEKPVGLVHMASARRIGMAAQPTVTHTERQYGAVGRSAVRIATVRDAVAMLQAEIDAT